MCSYVSVKEMNVIDVYEQQWLHSSVGSASNRQWLHQSSVG